MSRPAQRTLRVAAVQMACPDHEYSRNFERARVLVEESSRRGAQLILLPELFRAGMRKSSTCSHGIQLTTAEAAGWTHYILKFGLRVYVDEV